MTKAAMKTQEGVHAWLRLQLFINIPYEIRGP